MSALSYIQIISSLLGCWFIGYTITKSNLFSLPIGIFVLGSLIALLCRFIPLYTLLIIKILLLFSIINFIIRNKYKYFLSNFHKKEFFKFSYLFIFFLLFFIRFHYNFINYEPHDVVYFSPSIELSLSDYIGNLRSLTYYPSELSGHPIFTASVLSVATVFVTDLNLINLLEARYILIAILFSVFFYLFNFLCKLNIFLLCFILILSLYLFESLVSHSLIYSGIFGIVLCAYIFLLLGYFQIKYLKIISYISLILLMVKPGITFIFWMFPIYFFFKYDEVRKDKYFYIISILVFFNYLTWIILPVPIGNAYIDIFNPLNLKEYFYVLLSSSWFNNSIFFNFINDYYNVKEFIIVDKTPDTFFRNNLTKVVIDIFEFINFSIITFLFSYIFLNKSGASNKKLFFIFISFCLICFVFLRHSNFFGNKTTEQVVHIYHYLSILSIILIIMSIEKKIKKKYFIILILFFIINLNNSYFYGDNEFRLREKNNQFLIYKNLNLDKTDQKFYVIDKNLKDRNALLKEELKATILGKRIHREEYDNFEDPNLRPQIINWTYPIKHKFIWNNQKIEIEKNDSMIRNILK